MLIAIESNVNHPQFGFVVSKKVGNAVYRHRMTRLLRQITVDTLKKNNLENTSFQCQYVAFKYSDNYDELSKEYSKQIIDALSNSRTTTN
jgi:ribonuclease P protein component